MREGVDESPKILMDQVILILHIERMCSFHSKLRLFWFTHRESQVCAPVTLRTEITAHLTAVSSLKFILRCPPKSLMVGNYPRSQKSAMLGLASKCERK